MSTIGPQEALTASPEGEWELVGRDMIRTKRNPDGSGGMIVAQFWTAPSPEHAALMIAAPDMLAALKAMQAYAIAEIQRGGAHHDPVWAQVADAIAKAEGRS